MTADAWAEMRFDLGQIFTRVDIHYDLFIPSNYAHRDATGPDNNKFFRLWPTDYGDLQKVGASLGYDAGYSKIGEDYVTAGNTSISTNVTSTNGFVTADDLNAWMAVKIVVIAPTDSQAGVIEIYKNNVLFHSSNSVQYHAGTQGYRHGYLLGWANSGFTNTTYLHIDNLKFYGANV